MTASSRIPAVTTAVAIVLLYTNVLVVLDQRGVLPGQPAAVIPLLLGVAVLHQLVICRRPIVLDRTLWIMVSFLAVFLLAAFTAEGQLVALGRIGVYATEGILLYVLVRNAVRSSEELRAAILAVLVAASVLSALTVVQGVTGAYEQDYMGLAQRSLEHLEEQGPAAADEMGLEDRARGPVGDPNRFAQILLMAAPLAGVLGMNAGGRRGALAAWLCLALFLGAVLLTYSRGAFVTLLVLLVLTVPLGLLRPRQLAAGLVAGVLVTTALVPGYVGRIASMAGVADLVGRGAVEADGPTRGRTTEMLSALAAYVEHPVLGVGPGQYLPYHSVRYQSLPELGFREIALPRRAHNLYLELAAETGTVGLVVFLAIPLLLLRDLEALRRMLARVDPAQARLAAGLSLVLVSYLGTGVFLHLSFERYYWFIVALTAAGVGVLTARVRAASDADIRQPSGLAGLAFGAPTRRGIGC